MHSEVTYTCNGPFFLGRGLQHFTTASQQPLIFIKKRKDFAISFCQSSSIDSFRWYLYIYFWQQYRIRHSRVTSTIMLLLQGTTACLYYVSNISKKQLWKCYSLYVMISNELKIYAFLQLLKRHFLTSLAGFLIALVSKIWQ